MVSASAQGPLNTDLRVVIERALEPVRSIFVFAPPADRVDQTLKASQLPADWLSFDANKRPLGVSAVALPAPALHNAKHTKCFLSISTISGLFKTTARVARPFPQTLPRQLPVLMTIKIGFLLAAASLRASLIVYFQGIVVHG